METVYIPYVTKTDLLGLTIDNRLSWSDQIEKSVKSYGKKLAPLKNIRFVPENGLNNLESYCTLYDIQTMNLVKWK